MKFRNYMSLFPVFEMARSEKSDKPPVPIFDGDDQKYYKYIYDAGKKFVEEKRVKDPKNFLRLLVQQAICFRYGRSSDTSGVVFGSNRTDKDLVDKTFNAGGYSIEIKGIPMYPRQVIDKVTALNWDVTDPNFGYGFGPCTWKALMGERAEQYIKFFEDGTEPDKKHRMWHPRFNAPSTKATAEDKQRFQSAIERGSGKKKRDFGEFDVKSMEPIPLDDDDKKFLDSVEKSYNSFVAKGLKSGSFPKPPPMDLIKSLAMAMRYSNKFIDQSPDGKFHVKSTIQEWRFIEARKANPSQGLFSFPEEEPKKEEPKSSPYVTLTISYLGHPIVLDNVYMNLPELAKKFQRYVHSKNFVKEPINRQAASRWIQSGLYRPNAGTGGGGSFMQDNAFYEQIKKDQAAWVKHGGPGAVGNPVSPELAEKLTWRKGNTIEQSPNIQDAGLKRNTDKMQWDQILEDDARRAVTQTVKLMSARRYSRGNAFLDWANQPEEKQNLINRAITELMVRKTGERPELYRSEKQRLKWANGAVERAIDETFAKRGKGEAGKGEEDLPSDIDTAASKEGGLTANTGVTSHRTGEMPEPVDVVAPKVQHAVPEPEEDRPPRGVSPEDWEAEIARQQQQQPQLVLTRPPMIPMRQWLKMNRDEKIKAMRRAGL